MQNVLACKCLPEGESGNMDMPGAVNREGFQPAGSMPMLTHG